MKINSAVVLVTFGGESHEGPLWSNGSRKDEHTPKSVCPRGALYSIQLLSRFHKTQSRFTGYSGKAAFLFWSSSMNVIISPTT
jgi:hypothetical protein